MREVKSLGNFPDRFLAEIAGQPEAIRRAAARPAEQRDALARRRPTPRRRRRDRLHRHGQLLRRLLRPGHARSPARASAASMVDAAELLHFRLAALGPGTLLVAVSQSGRERRAGAAGARRWRPRRPRPIAGRVTNGARRTRSPASADIALDTRGRRGARALDDDVRRHAGGAARGRRALAGDPPAAPPRRRRRRGGARAAARRCPSAARRPRRAGWATGRCSRCSAAAARGRRPRWAR